MQDSTLDEVIEFIQTHRYNFTNSDLATKEEIKRGISLCGAAIRILKTYKKFKEVVHKYHNPLDYTPKIIYS